MSSLFGMIYKGVSGLNASQVAIDVTGQNITNMKNTNYSRQIVSFVASKPEYTYVGSIGMGVKVAGINRAYDDLLAKSVRNESSSLSYYNSMSTTLKNSMLYFNELAAGSGLGDSLKNYFDAWSSLASSAPDNTDSAIVKRNSLIEKADTLASKIREGYASIASECDKVNDNIKTNVTSINQITQNIAQLNGEIAKTEVGGHQANDLRDARDALLDQLSELVNITTSERENGEIAVLVAGQTIVDGNTAHILEAVGNKANNGYYDVYWKTENINSNPVKINQLITGGSTAAAFKARDESLPKYLSELDSLASSLIIETNKQHAQGQGLTRPSQVTGTNGVINPTYPLSNNLGKLSYPVTTGSFRITLYNDKGEAKGTYDIHIDPNNTNLLGVIDQINSIAGSSTTSTGATANLQAYLSDNNSIQIVAGSGYSLAFSSDTSGFLAAAGINTFFSGSSAKDIDLAGLVKNNPNYIATSKTGAPGDNTNATAISNIQYKALDGKSTITIGQFYGVFIGQMGSDKAQTDGYAATKNMAFKSLYSELQSIRGVSESEELVNLSLYQRTFEANSRYINVVDEMLNTVINGLGVGGR